jgi:hypothetical protein
MGYDEFSCKGITRILGYKIFIRIDPLIKNSVQELYAIVKKILQRLKLRIKSWGTFISAKKTNLP